MTDHSLTTTCPLDCPDGCALEVTVVGDGVERIGGSHDHPVTAGFICSKVRRFGRRLTHADRLLHPMRRVGPKGSGQYARIEWDDAIADITARFKHITEQWGAEAILPYHYGGSNGLLTDGFLDDLFFARLGASRLAKTLCAAPATAVAIGMYGKMPGVAFEDYVHAKCIIIWGANPKASNIHLVPYLRRAKERGAFIAVVDPVRNLSPNEVDLHLAVRPGTDLAVALAMIGALKEGGELNQAFLKQHANNVDPILQAASEWPVDRAAVEAGVSQADLRHLARVFARSEPAVIRCGWGVERNRNGGQAVAAILALPALLGKFGVRGGGYTLSNSGAAVCRSDKLFDTTEWNTRSVNMTQLGGVLNGAAEPPIKALFVYNCNPAVTVPDQRAVLRGLEREDLFTVVHEQVMTDTAKYADILLPATTFLEHWDLRVSYGSYAVGGVRPVVAPRGESLSNPEVFARLGQAMGFDDEAFSWDPATAFRTLTDVVTLHSAPADFSTLAAGKSQTYRFPEPTPVQLDSAFPLTADGKIDLCPPQLGAHPFSYHRVGSSEYPLQLISPATSRLVSSTLGEFNMEKLRASLHPSDAEVRGIASGERVRIFNHLGEVICEAEVSDRVKPGVVVLPKGSWRKASLNGMTTTALCPAHVNEVAGGACYNDAWVEVEKDR
ncbi:MAG: molybdopterin-dependent oxidoreductase [Gemmatimonadota bacterium]|nr:MAG: molybdopterin-dependent oxidoreductase [Gemmatimonadota bacterium]